MLQAVWQFLSSCKSPCDAFPPTLWLTEACNRASQLRAMSQWLLPLQTHSLQPSHSFELCKHHRKRLTLAKVKKPVRSYSNLQKLTATDNRAEHVTVWADGWCTANVKCAGMLGWLGPGGPGGPVGLEDVLKQRSWQRQRASQFVAASGPAPKSIKIQ